MENRYWIGRQRSAMTMAQTAATAEARLIHYDLAGRYGIRAAQSHPSPLPAALAVGERAVLHLRDPASPATPELTRSHEPAPGNSPARRKPDEPGPGETAKLPKPARRNQRRNAMFGFRGGEAADIVTRKRLDMKDAQQRWPFLTNFDASTIRNELQLIAIVKDRSGRPRAEAEADVNLWLAGRQKSATSAAAPGASAR